MSNVERIVPTLKPAALEWQSDGFKWREAFVRLPAGMVLQDLNDKPDMWKHVQADRQKALRQWDRLRIVAHGEDWMCDCTVAFADADQVVLAGIRKTDLPKRTDTTFQDGTYKIEWTGAGYGVFRILDGVRMIGESFHTIEAAKMRLLSLYPRKVG